MGRIDTFPGQVAATTFVGAKATRSAAYNVPNAADTALPWDIEEFDSHGFHDNVTQNTRLTVPAGFEGYYHVGACWSSTAPSVDQRRHILTIKKNGTTLKGMASEHSTSGSQAYSGPMASGSVYLAAGDYVEAFAYQDSGGTLALDTAKAGFWLYRVAEVAPAPLGTSGRGKYARRTSGTITLNSLTWANVDTGLDLTIAAAVGDLIQYQINGGWGTENVYGFLDVVTVVSGSPVTSFSNSTATPATSGISGWVDKNTADTPGASQALTGSAWHTLVSGDISGGNVTLRLRYKTGTAANKSLYATTTDPLLVAVVNHGASL
jgi:hypothetical protein